MINLTQQAATHFANVIEREQATGIMFELDRRGCSGFGYTTTIVTAAPDLPHHHYVCNGINIYIPAEHLSRLDGTTVDMVKQGLGTKITFDNPHVASSCGCGESVALS